MMESFQIELQNIDKNLEQSEKDLELLHTQKDELLSLKLHILKENKMLICKNDENYEIELM